MLLLCLTLLFLAKATQQAEELPGVVTDDNFFSVAGKIYYTNNTTMPWSAALNFCKQRDMYQASLKTAKQVQDLAFVLEERRFPYALWLSASDIGSTPGDFKWADATPVDSISWAVNNPNAFREGQETCVVFDMKDGRLRDWDCTKYYFVLCELPKQITAC